jgi:predicted regulator of Ras-like GTPase activity (Roadblock/LC7/MglB family)
MQRAMSTLMTPRGGTSAAATATTSLVRSILRTMNAANPEICASAVMSSDGLVIASMLQDSVDADRFGAMSASLLALAERAAQEIERGDLTQVLVGGTRGSVLLVQAGHDHVLAVGSTPEAQLGRIFLEARRTASRIEQCLDPRAGGDTR